MKDVEVRRSVISAAGNSIDEQPAFAFLLGVAKNDADWESRRTAVRQLGHFQREDAAEELMKIYTNDANIEVKRRRCVRLRKRRARARRRVCSRSRAPTRILSCARQRFAC